MKGLSVRQPWASLIAAGHKDVENRSRRTLHRGVIAIHASIAVYRDAVVLPDDGRAALNAMGGLAGVWDARTGTGGHPLLARSAIIAVAELVGSHHFDCPSENSRCSPWAWPRSWHWLLTNARPLATPVVATGRLGLWDLPDDVEAAVLDQLSVTP